jgi:hypothetical protein
VIDMAKFTAPEEVRLPRVTKGKRPYFFEDPNFDQMMTFFLELMMEVSVVRERLDSVERLLDQKTAITREDIENYRPDAAVEAERVAWRDAYVKRVLRMHVPEGRQE